MNPRSSTYTPHGGRGFAAGVACGVSRRQFFGTAAGLAVGAGLSTSLGAQGGNPHTDASPTPIPGGVSPFGVFIHHFPVVPTGTPFAALTDPSQITDFNGFVGLNRIRGQGAGTGLAAATFQADMGFMVGECVGTDGKHYNASFGFI
jgi:hypothetical protein